MYFLLVAGIVIVIVIISIVIISTAKQCRANIAKQYKAMKSNAKQCKAMQGYAVQMKYGTISLWSNSSNDDMHFCIIPCTAICVAIIQLLRTMVHRIY